MDKRIGCIIVTYNRKELLKESILCHLSAVEDNVSLIIIDNYSNDGTYEYIEEFIDGNKVHYFNTGSNIGGAGGFSYGLKVAYDLGFDLFWLMDDDCIVNKDSLVHLLEAAETLKDAYGFLVSKVIWTDGNICNMNIPKVNLFRKNQDWNTPIVPVEYGTFVSMLIKREIIERNGLPIAEYFIWADDMEFSRRISRMENCYLVNQSEVVHKCKTNVGSNIAQDDSKNLWRYEYAYRNEVPIYIREGILGSLYLNVRILLHIKRILFSKLNDEDKKNRIHLILTQTKRGYAFKPQVKYVGKAGDK